MLWLVWFFVALFLGISYVIKELLASISFRPDDRWISLPCYLRMPIVFLALSLCSLSPLSELILSEFVFFRSDSGEVGAEFTLIASCSYQSCCSWWFGSSFNRVISISQQNVTKTKEKMYTFLLANVRFLWRDVQFQLIAWRFCYLVEVKHTMCVFLRWIKLLWMNKISPLVLRARTKPVSRIVPYYTHSPCWQFLDLAKRTILSLSLSFDAEFQPSMMRSGSYNGYEVSNTLSPDHQPTERERA